MSRNDSETTLKIEVEKARTENRKGSQGRSSSPLEISLLQFWAYFPGFGDMIRSSGRVRKVADTDKFKCQSALSNVRDGQDPSYGT